MIDVLELDQPQLIEYRRSKIGAIKSHVIHNQELYIHEMGFPTNLPDLTESTPPINTRPEGIGKSWFVVKSCGSPFLVY